jgi:chromosome segregation ATPase
MTPTMTPTKDLADALRFGLPMNPIEAVRVCNEAADRLEELEEQLAAEREQITILRSDQRRLEGFAKTYRLRADEAEAKLEREVAVWKHEAKRLEAELKKLDEQAISWWCEYQDLKAKARES